MKNVRHVRSMQMLVILLMTMIVLASCGGGLTAPAVSPTTATDGAAAPAVTADFGVVAPTTATEDGVTESAEVAGKTNITYWTHDNAAFVKATNELIRGFQEANPDINIVYQHFPYDVLINKLQTAYASSTEPDMQQMFGTWATEYAKKGLLTEVSIPRAQLEEQFWPAALGAYTVEGKVYGLPQEYNLENGGMLINKKMLASIGAEVPTTWDQIREVGKQLTKWNGEQLEQSGFAFTNNDSITFMYLSLILQQGAKYWDDEGKYVNFNTPEGKAAWVFETGLETTDKLTQERAFGPTVDTFDVFYQQKAAMGFRGPWVIGTAVETYPDVKYGTDFDYVPVPSFVDGTPPLFAAESGWGTVVSSRSKNKEASLKFLEFMSQPDNAREWNNTTATVPSIKALKDDAKLLEVTPALKTSFDALQYGQWIGEVQNRDRFFKVIHDHYTAVVLGQEKPEDSPALMTTEINAMIDEYLGP